MSESGTKLAVDNVELFVVQHGTGRPIIVLGGPWFGHTYLSQLHTGLAHEFRVIAYDPRGSGHSSALTQGEITLEGHLHDLDGLRRALKLDKLNLLGHSMGALIALLYAARHQTAMGSLVLLHPGPPLDEKLQKELHRAFESGHLSQDKARLEELASSPGFATRDAGTLEEYFRVLYSPFFVNRANTTRLAFSFTATTARYALEAEERLLGEVLEQDPLAKAGEVNSPTLVVHGERDLIPESFSAQLAKAISGAEYVRLPGLGHFAYLEDASSSIPPIVDFLTREAR